MKTSMQMLTIISLIGLVACANTQKVEPAPRSAPRRDLSNPVDPNVPAAPAAVSTATTAQATSARNLAATRVAATPSSAPVNLTASTNEDNKLLGCDGLTVFLTPPSENPLFGELVPDKRDEHGNPVYKPEGLEVDIQRLVREGQEWEEITSVEIYWESLDHSRKMSYGEQLETIQLDRNTIKPELRNVQGIDLWFRFRLPDDAIVELENGRSVRLTFRGQSGRPLDIGGLTGLANFSNAFFISQWPEFARFAVAMEPDGTHNCDVALELTKRNKALSNASCTGTHTIEIRSNVPRRRIEAQLPGGAPLSQ